MELSFKLDKTSEFIFDYLSNMDKFTMVHPVISKIDKTSENNYLVHETLKFGIIPFSFTYPVVIESKLKEKEVKINATVFKVTKIQMKFSLKSEINGTTVFEDIQIKTPMPIKKMMCSVFRKQHALLFENIASE